MPGNARLKLEVSNDIIHTNPIRNHFETYIKPNSSTEATISEWAQIERRDRTVDDKSWMVLKTSWLIELGYALHSTPRQAARKIVRGTH